MDRRSKILAAVFGLAVVYAMGAKTVYPTYIKPLFTYGERIAEQQKKLDKLLAVKDKVEQARLDYKSFVQRTGSFDMATVENAIRQRLYTLIELHNLKDWTVSPGRKSTDRKTQVKSMLLTIQAQGPVQGVAGLLWDVAELPYLVRFGNVTISPSKSTLGNGRMTLHEQVSFRLPIEIKVLPQHHTAGRIDPATLTDPEAVTRHQHRDYSALWADRSFSEYVTPRPLKADAGKDQNLSKPGRTIAVRGSATGGVGEYTYLWSPSEGLDNPTRQATKVDSSKPGEFEYTLTVTDEAGTSSSDTVTVKIAEPRRIVKRPPPPKPKPRAPSGPARWPDRRFMQIVMSLGRTYRGERRDELMVYERKGKQTSYYAAGDEFDGGELVYVHQTGGLVRRKDDYFVYPIGAPLDKDLPLESADEFPELQRAAKLHQELIAQQTAAKGESAEPATDAAPASGQTTAPASASVPVVAPDSVTTTKPAQGAAGQTTPAQKKPAVTTSPAPPVGTRGKTVPVHPAPAKKAGKTATKPATKPATPRGKVSTPRAGTAGSHVGRLPGKPRPKRRPKQLGGGPR